jgi:hypothetical protein
MSNARENEHVDWETMGPIYKDEVEALKRKIEELEQKLIIKRRPK